MRRRAGQREIDLARADRAEGALGQRVADHDDDAGMALPHSRDRSGDERRGERGQRRDDHTAGVPRGDVLGPRGNRRERAEHLVDDRQQVGAGARRRDRSRIAIEQAHAERFLELADLRGQRRLRRVQHVGCAREAAQASDRRERAELPEREIHIGMR